MLRRVSGFFPALVDFDDCHELCGEDHLPRSETGTNTGVGNGWKTNETGRSWDVSILYVETLHFLTFDKICWETSRSSLLQDTLCSVTISCMRKPGRAMSERRTRSVEVGMEVACM